MTLTEDKKDRPDHVTGPLGEALTIDMLPPADTERWTAHRKAKVVAAVTGGLLSVEEACKRYDLSLDEFTLWQESLKRSGVFGLRATSVQRYRELYARQDAAKAKQAHRGDNLHDG